LRGQAEEAVISDGGEVRRAGTFRYEKGVASNLKAQRGGEGQNFPLGRGEEKGPYKRRECFKRMGRGRSLGVLGIGIQLLD